MTFIHKKNRFVISFFIAFFVGTLLTFESKAQLSEDQYKVVLCYNFLKNMEWQNGVNGSKFVLGVLNDDKALTKAFKDLEGREVLGKQITVKEVSDGAGIKNAKCHAVYLGDSYSTDVKSFLDVLQGTSTLIISDKSKDQKSVMINILVKNNKLSFEVNNANLLSENLKSGDKLLLLGGTEIDVRSLYRESQVKLEAEKELVNSQQKELAKQKAEIKEHRKLLTIQKEEMDKQALEIQKQQEAIKKQETQIIEQQEAILARNKEIENQRASLDSLLANIEKKNADLEKKEAQIATQDQKLTAQLKELDKGMEAIKEQEARIAEQKGILLKQNAEISFQQNLIYVAIAFVLLVLGLVYFVYRSMMIQKKAKIKIEAAHSELKLNREEIVAQNEELRQQQEEIMAINETLEVQKRELATKNISITQSIDYAQSIQEAVLPSPTEVKQVFFDYFIIYKPKDIVSGDFYFTAKKGDAKIVVVADCTGHGVPGAFMSLLGTNILNDIINVSGIIDPAKVLDVLQVKIKERLRQEESGNDDGMDLGVISFDDSSETTKVINYAGAKNRLYIMRKSSGELDMYNSDRIQIGGIGSRSKSSFTTEQIPVGAGDMIYMCTDGFQDQSNPNRKRYSSKRLQEQFKGIYTLSLSEQKDKLEKSLKQHQGASPQRDDITLLGLRVS